MKELIQYQIASLKEQLAHAQSKNDMETAKELAQTILTLRNKLRSINTRNWYSTRKLY